MRFASLLTWEQQRELDSLAPTHLQVPSGLADPDRLSRPECAGHFGALAGGFRARCHAADRRRPHPSHVQAPFTRAATGAGDAGSGEFLARLVRGRAQRHARPLSETLLAGKSAGSATDTGRAAQRRPDAPPIRHSRERVGRFSVESEEVIGTLRDIPARVVPQVLVFAGMHGGTSFSTILI